LGSPTLLLTSSEGGPLQAVAGCIALAISSYDKGKRQNAHLSLMTSSLLLFLPKYITSFVYISSNPASASLSARSDDIPTLDVNPVCHGIAMQGELEAGLEQTRLSAMRAK